jgi:hypothetical protein
MNWLTRDPQLPGVQGDTCTERSTQKARLTINCNNPNKGTGIAIRVNGSELG